MTAILSRNCTAVRCVTLTRFVSISGQSLSRVGVVAVRSRLVLLVTVCVLLGTGAVFGLAASGGASTPSPAASLQTAEWNLSTDHSSSRHWAYIDLSTPLSATEGFDVRSTGLLTVTVSANINGAPVQIRVLDRAKVEHPSLTAFAPSSANTAFSFTFVGTGHKEACGHLLRLQWRSPTGQRVRLTNGDLVVSYTPAADDIGPCS